jgi:hypothetical protein
MGGHGIGSPDINGLPHCKTPVVGQRFPPPIGIGILAENGDRAEKSTGIRGMERRLHSRHRARATVYVVAAGRRGALCKAHNLSANGVFVETRNLGLAKGSIVELAFAINLGAITKIHRRKAIVAHVSRGGTGLKMECYAAR